MKKAITLLAALLFTAAPVAATAGWPGAVNALAVQPQPPAQTSAPGLVVTSIASNEALAGTTLDGDELAELYNQGGAPLDVSAWELSFAVSDSCGDRSVSLSFPAGWMLPTHYLTLSATGVTAGCTGARLAGITLSNAGAAEQTIAIPLPTTTNKLDPTKIAQHHQRNNSASSTRVITGDFATDYSKLISVSDTANAVLYSDPLYTPPADTGGLQIVEILPNARDCSPLETDLTCSDYVKLYNPTAQPIDLAQYRLRIGYKGQSASVSNTFTWGQTLDPATDELLLPPYSYFTLTARNDGTPLSITDTGEYIWLEDAYGVQVYDPVVQYPDASSTTKVGWVWAFDGTGWRWSSAPQPAGANYFPPDAPASVISPVIPALSSCAPGQERNPATNRCRSIVATSIATQPCGAGQERNPATNRCRSVLGASTTAALKPCPAGQTRNPSTNRCRKDAAASVAAVQDVATAATSTGVQWPMVIAVLIAAGALGYAIFEWHQDMRLATANVQARVRQQLIKLIHRG